MMDPLVEEQIAYYRARAPEYDEWFLRQGRYDQGPEQNEQWRIEAAEVDSALERFNPVGNVLEIAGGTGVWTERLARTAARLTVVDASPESLAINRDRLRGSSVRYIEADIFGWRPDETYDAVFFAFWLSHVPPTLFQPFWALVDRCLRPGGRAFFVDTLRPSSAAFDHRYLAPGEIKVTRELNDGRRFQIYKLFYQPDDLTTRLQTLGWAADVRSTPQF